MSEDELQAIEALVSKRESDKRARPSDLELRQANNRQLAEKVPGLLAEARRLREQVAALEGEVERRAQGEG